MVIGVLGKGGSGKTTVATALVDFLARERRVLAVDADHNLDLTYNLAPDKANALPWFSGAFPVLRRELGAAADAPYRDVLLATAAPVFRFAEDDPVFAAFAQSVGERRWLMAAGKETEAVLVGERCSHSLFTPLKLYLPLLTVPADAAVVVDEKAGADGVTTGAVAGYDAVVVVAEPTVHSLKVAAQIFDLLTHYGTPGVLVLNKVVAGASQLVGTENLPAPVVRFRAALPDARGVTQLPLAELATLELALTAVALPSIRLARAHAYAARGVGR